VGKLDGKVAIVTGASRGIGRGISRALAREGASLVMTARGEEPPDALATQERAFVVRDDPTRRITLGELVATQGPEGTMEGEVNPDELDSYRVYIAKNFEEVV